MNLIKQNLSILLLITSFASASFADATQCHELFPKFEITTVAEQSSEIVRQTILDFLLKNRNIPAFIKKTRNGEVPVILINSQTLPLLKPLIEHSSGFMFAQQIGYRNDHGLMRAGNYIIDADTPGARGYGELHQTGLAWKFLDNYLPRRNTGSYVMIETGYLLSKEDQLTIESYQRIRRAAIFRIPFTFGGKKTKSALNTIENSGENCFGFCKAATLGKDITEITLRLTELGIQDVPALLGSPLIQKYLKIASDIILTANTDDPKSLNWGMVNGPMAIDMLNPLLPTNLTTEQKGILINWIVALDASKKYSELKAKNNISNDGGFQDLQNGKTSFILIYDSMDKKDQFDSATYSSKGVFYSWDSREQIALPPPPADQLPTDALQATVDSTQNKISRIQNFFKALLSPL